MNGAVSASAIVSGVTGTGSPAARPSASAFERSGSTATTRTPARHAGGRDPGDETAAAAGDDDRVDAGHVLEDLEPDGAGAGDHDRIVERVHEHAPRLLLELVQPRERRARARPPRGRPSAP